MNRTGWLVTGFVLTALMIMGGCGQNMAWQVTDPGMKSSDSIQAGNCQEQLELLLPERIDVLPFTKPKSWDNDQNPDGLEVVLRPLDSFGDQTKAIGLFRFELFLYEKASSDCRGARIGFWEENLNSRDAQYQHWDRITRTYRFRLGWVGQQVRPGKYVLEVTYIAPSGRRLSDAYIMEARPSREQIKEKIEKQQQGGLKLF